MKQSIYLIAVVITKSAIFNNSYPLSFYSHSRNSQLSQSKQAIVEKLDECDEPAMILDPSNVKHQLLQENIDKGWLASKFFAKCQFMGQQGGEATM